MKSLRIMSLAVINIYRLVSPMIGHLSGVFSVRFQCRFPISCSKFAKDELIQNPSWIGAMRRIFGRLIICSPLYRFVSEKRIQGVAQ